MKTHLTTVFCTLLHAAGSDVETGALTLNQNLLRGRNVAPSAVVLN